MILTRSRDAEASVVVEAPISGTFPGEGFTFLTDRARSAGFLVSLDEVADGDGDGDADGGPVPRVDFTADPLIAQVVFNNTITRGVDCVSAYMLYAGRGRDLGSLPNGSSSLTIDADVDGNAWTAEVLAATTFCIAIASTTAPETVVWDASSLEIAATADPFATDPYTGLGPGDPGDAITTVAASSVTSTDAVLNATTNLSGDGVMHFEYGTTVALGYSTPSEAVGAGLTPGITYSLGGLSPGITYFFRGVVVSTVPGDEEATTFNGNILSFTTSSTGDVVLLSL